MVSEMTGWLYILFSSQNLRKDHYSPRLLPESVWLFTMTALSSMIPALQYGTKKDFLFSYMFCSLA